MSNEQERTRSAKEANVSAIITDKVTELPCSQCGCKLDVSDVEPFVKIECPECHNIEIVPAKLGHFTLLRLIGAGGMGGVYYAKDESLGRFVAIKIMLESLGTNQEFIETFRREAQAVAKLNHPNIAQIYSFGTEKNQPYIVMELVSGQRFDKLIANGEALDQGLVMKIGLEIAEALSAADEIGLTHGDIKPENILLDDKWKAKLVDFGLARFVGQAADEGIWGTPYYIAPEKVRRQKVDSRSDIYSLGATLYHALTGKPPFDGKTPIEVVKARLEREPMPLHLVRTNINQAVESIVTRMLEVLPARRYPNYSSLISDLRNVVKELGADSKNYAAKAGRKTVKLLVPRKTGMHSMSAKTDADAANPGKPTARIKQGKKRTTSFVVAAGTTRNIDATGMDNLEDSEFEGSALDEYKNRKFAEAAAADAAREKRLKVVLWIILALVLSAIGYGVAYHIKQAQIREKLEREALFAIQAQVSSADETYARLHIVATNVVGLEMSERSMTDKATNIACIALGDATTRQEQVNDPAIATAARRIVAAANRIKEKVQFARQTDAAALTIKNETVKATTITQAKSGVDKLSELLASLAISQNDAKQTLANIDKDTKEIIAIQAKADKEKKDAEEKEAKEKKDKAEAQLAEEHKAVIQKELHSAESAQSGCVALITQNRYQEAAAELTSQSSNYTTEEGKKAIKMAIEKCNRLQSLKLFVIERLNADQYPWGYYDQDTRSQVDVTGADEKEVKVRTKTVAWTAINAAQMRKFIDRALSSDKVPIQMQADQNFAAAIFSVMNGLDKAAKTYLDKALSISPSLRNDAEQLLPNLQ
jgi:serine/threonine protein kinase